VQGGARVRGNAGLPRRSTRGTTAWGLPSRGASAGDRGEVDPGDAAGGGWVDTRRRDHICGVFSAGIDTLALHRVARPANLAARRRRRRRCALQSSTTPGAPGLARGGELPGSRSAGVGSPPSTRSGRSDAASRTRTATGAKTADLVGEETPSTSARRSYLPPLSATRRRGGWRHALVVQVGRVPGNQAAAVQSGPAGR